MKVLPPPAAVSCADAGSILRGTVEDSRKAGPAKEAAIASACMHDKWSQDILDCIGTEHDAKACLAKLSTEQRAALDTKLTAWTEIYDGETWDTAEDEQIANEPTPIACNSLFHPSTVATLVPPLVQQGEEREFAATARRTAVIQLCEAWPRPVRLCIHEGGGLSSCRARLDLTHETALAGKLAAIDALMTKIVAVKKKPAATYECKAVVAAHYRDAAWRGKAEPPKNPKATRAELAQQATERKQMIADSRKLMLDACVGELWNATLRACELAGGGELCAQGSGRPARWGFPAAGVMMRTGIAECDAYGQTIQTLMTCTKIPQPTKDTIKHSFDQIRDSVLKTTSADAMKAIAQSCQQGDQSLQRAITAIGCP